MVVLMCWYYLHSPVVDCGHLSPPVGGSVTLTGTTVGSQAFYSCGKGYELMGDSVRTCQFNGLWTGKEPICERKYIHCISGLTLLLSPTMCHYWDMPVKQTVYHYPNVATDITDLSSIHTN